VPQLILDAQRSGLLVDVHVGPSAARRSALYKQGLLCPPPVFTTLIIDTGADSTMIDESLALALALTPTGQARVLTSQSRGVPEPCNVFDVEIEVINRTGNPSWRIQPLQVLARPLHNLSIGGMLGRDVLSLCVLVSDGPRRTFTLNY
jgi:hypothetical protein